jgi:hypothetical protein
MFLCELWRFHNFEGLSFGVLGYDAISLMGGCEHFYRIHSLNSENHR